MQLIAEILWINSSDFPDIKRRAVLKNRYAGLPPRSILEHVRQYLEEFDGVRVTETMIRETAEDCGSELIHQDEKRADSADIPPAKSTGVLYIQADGSMVPIRSCDGKTVEYRGNKVGLLFREEDIERRPDKKCRINKKQFVNSLGRGVEHFEKLLKRRAAECGSSRAKTLVFLSDGAEWLDRMRKIAV